MTGASTIAGVEEFLRERRRGRTNAKKATKVILILIPLAAVIIHAPRKVSNVSTIANPAKRYECAPSPGFPNKYL